MTTNTANACDLKQETLDGLKELCTALKDSVEYHNETIKQIDDKFVEDTFSKIATERQAICEELSRQLSYNGEKVVDDGTFLGSMRTIWTKMRAGINSGDTTVVLTEAERAEDVIVNRFKDILPEIAGNPLNAQLVGYFETVKDGHDRVLALRNAFQAK